MTDFDSPLGVMASEPNRRRRQTIIGLALTAALTLGFVAGMLTSKIAGPTSSTAAGLVGQPADQRAVAETETLRNICVMLQKQKHLLNEMRRRETEAWRAKNEAQNDIAGKFEEWVDSQVRSGKPIDPREVASVRKARRAAGNRRRAPDPTHDLLRTQFTELTNAIQEKSKILDPETARRIAN